MARAPPKKKTFTNSAVSEQKNMSDLFRFQFFKDDQIQTLSALQTDAVFLDFCGIQGAKVSNQQKSGVFVCKRILHPKVVVSVVVSNVFFTFHLEIWGRWSYLKSICFNP